MRLAPTEAARRGRLYVLASLLAMMATFAIGARSWAHFFLSPQEANGAPVRLFTQTDYPAIAIASRIVASGRGAQLYDLEVQRQEQDKLASEGYLYLPQGLPLKYPYPYAPFIAALWSPLSGLSPLLGIVFWNLLNLGILVAGLWYLLASLPLPVVMRAILLLGALTSFPLIVNLEQGQSSGIVLGAMAGGIALLRREKDLQGGLVLGLLALKAQWLPFILLTLLWKLRWRALLGVASTTVALAALVLLTMGTEWVPSFLRVVDGVGRWDRALLLDPWYSHSLSGGLTALLGRGTDEMVRTLTLVTTLFMVIVVVLVWRGPWQPRSPKWDGAMALTILVAIFTNLQVNTHDLVLLVVPCALGLSALYQLQNEDKLRVWWYGLLWASYLTPAFFLSAVFTLPVRLTTLLIAVLLALMIIMLLRKQRSKVIPQDLATGF